MINNETHLLYSVLCYEEGHCRRTQHILKVYALAKLFGEQEKISVEDQQILQAAAILHDVAIKYCKEHYNGDASQNNQKQVVSILVTRFLESANYLPSYVPKIIESSRRRKAASRSTHTTKKSSRPSLTATRKRLRTPCSCTSKTSSRA